MVDDERRAKSNQDPFRQELTYDELRALLDGKPLHEVLQQERSKQEEREVVAESEADDETMAIQVTEVPDPFQQATKLHSTASNHHADELAPRPVESSADVTLHNIPEEEAELIAQTKTFAPDETEVVHEPSRRTKEKPKRTAAGRMLRGALWMSIGSMASRILGALYIIPWVAMMGVAYSTSANSLYAQGYQIYSVFLLIATAGLPNVLARLVAEYHAKNEYHMVKQVYRSSLNLGGVMGIIAASALYLLSPILSQGHSDVVPVLHALAIAVLIIPIQSMLRGYVQGFEFMGISALSQFVEQLVRVIYMLAATYWIMVAGHGNWVDATVQSTLGAFWGAIAGTLVVIGGILTHRKFFREQEMKSDPSLKPANTIMRRMLRQSFPIVLAGSAISLVQVIDQYTFFRIMEKFSNFDYQTINNMFAQFAFNSNKLVMLVVSLAVAMSETALPMLSRAKAIGDDQATGEQIQFAFKLLGFVMIPATLGMVALAHPLYILFYGHSDVTNGVLILQFASYTAIFLGLYIVVLSIFQGIGDLRYTLRFMAIIMVAKLIFQVPLTIWLAGIGPLAATIVAFTIGLFFAIRKLVKRYPVEWSGFAYSLMTMLFWSVVMFVVIWPVVGTIENFLGTQGRMSQLILMIIGVGLGAGIYMVAALKTSLARDVLGPRADRLAARLHLN